MCEIGVGFSSAALSVFRLRRAEAASAVWIPHWHSEPFESQGARAAKRYVNGEPRRAGGGGLKLESKLLRRDRPSVLAKMFSPPRGSKYEGAAPEIDSQIDPDITPNITPDISPTHDP